MTSRYYKTHRAKFVTLTHLYWSFPHACLLTHWFAVLNFVQEIGCQRWHIRINTHRGNGVQCTGRVKVRREWKIIVVEMMKWCWLRLGILSLLLNVIFFNYKLELDNLMNNQLSTNGQKVNCIIYDARGYMAALGNKISGKGY